MITIPLDNTDTKPFYIQIYEYIRKEILNGNIAAEEKLPSARNLAANLNVSRSTVDTAYDQLVAEGYLDARPRQGYFANHVTHLKQIPTSAPQKENNEKNTKEAPPVRFDFNPDSIDLEHFPYSIWKSIGKNQLDLPSNFSAGDAKGDLPLRQAIANYLRGSRGVICRPEQIIIGAGTEYLYGILIQLLGFDKKYAIEDPGYHKIAKIYNSHNVDCDYIAMDDSGIRISELEEKNIDVIHISPSHQFPTGITMPIGRRYELLGWASKAPSRYIIEDDYDSEFRLTGQPIPTLQSIDVLEKVIYINTFTKTLASTVRISYMVLPKHLVKAYYAKMQFYSCTVSGFEQYAMAAFLEKGYFERHIRRLLNDYRGQRERICRMFRESPLSQISQIYQDDAGTHFLLHVRTELSDVEIKWAARQRGILVNCLSEYCFADAQKYRGILVIHYSDMADEILQKVIGALEEIFCNYSEP